MDEYPVNRSEPDTSVNAGRPGRSYFPQGRFGPMSESPTIHPKVTGRLQQGRFRPVYEMPTYPANRDARARLTAI